MSEIKTIHVENETPSGSVNGTNKDFVIDNLPDPTASLEVVVGGITLILDVDYTISDYTISFIEAPASPSVIRVNYRHIDASVLTLTISKIVDAGILAALDQVDSAEIVDGAVILQKLTANKRVIMSAFESLDGWSVDGLTIQDMANIKVYTTDVENNLSSFYAVPSNWTGLDWAKDFFWQSAVKINQVTNQEIQFGMGATDDIGAFSAAGFKITDGTLSVFHAVDAGGASLVYTTQEISGITLTDWNVYRMVYDQSAGTLKFYINGTLVHTFDSSLPTENDDAVTSYQIKTTAGAVKQMYTSDLLISIDR